MSANKKHKRLRIPASFAEIGPGERVRWSLGLILIEGETTPGPAWTEGAPLPHWASWGEWAETYSHVRGEYLTWYASKHGPDARPGAELRFAAYERGEDPSQVEVPMPPDPRRVLRESIHGNR